VRLWEEVKEAALCACEADVVKVYVCVRGVRPSRLSGLSRDSGELRERLGRRRMGCGMGPNLYAKAATGPEE
jgi:hypothetical protein